MTCDYCNYGFLSEIHTGFGFGFACGLVGSWMVSEGPGKNMPVALSKGATILTIGALLNSNLFPLSVKVGGVVSGIIMGTEISLNSLFSLTDRKYTPKFNKRVSVRGCASILMGVCTAYIAQDLKQSPIVSYACGVLASAFMSAATCVTLTRQYIK